MWFSASILMKSLVNGSNISDLWMEDIVLVETSDCVNAEILLKSIALQSENEYFNSSGEKVFWKFDSILSIYEIPEKNIVSGCEIFSRLWTSDEIEKLKGIGNKDNCD